MNSKASKAMPKQTRFVDTEYRTKIPRVHSKQPTRSMGQISRITFPELPRTGTGHHRKSGPLSPSEPDPCVRAHRRREQSASQTTPPDCWRPPVRETPREETRCARQARRGVKGIEAPNADLAVRSLAHKARMGLAWPPRRQVP